MSDFISSGLNKKIDHLMDICFGAGVAAHQTIIEQLNYLFFIRALSKKDEEAEQLGISEEKVFVKELAKYNWDALLALNAEELFGSLEKAFIELPKHTNNKTIQIVFANAHVKIYSKAALRQILHEIDKLESQLDSLANKGQHDVFGDMYEYLLSKMAAAGSIGMFRTPRHIIKFMVEAVDPAKGQYILDPACGTAGFLVAAHTYLGQKYTSPDLYKDSGRYSFDKLLESERDFVQNKAFTGFDSESEIIKFGLMNALLHDMHGIKLKRQNTLVDTTGDRTKYDVILANPPFAGKIDKSSVSEDIAMGTGATEILFLRYMLDHLSSNGKMAVIVPEGVIFSGSSAHKTIRKMLLEQGLYAVVSLPSGVFNPYAGVKTSILFVDKSLQKDEILFVKVNHDGFALNANRNPIDKDDLPEVIDIMRKFQVNEELESSLAHIVDKAIVIESGDYNLSGDRYKTVGAPSRSGFASVKLGDKELFQIESGGTPSSREPSYWDGTINWVTLADLPSENRITYIEKTSRKITDSGLAKSSAKILPAGTVLISSRATIGRIAVAKFETCTNQGFKNIIIKTENILPEYIAYLLSGATDKLRNIASGGTFAEFSKSALENFEIPVPPIEAQKDIVAELDGYQKIIDAAQSIVKTYKPTIKINPTWDNIQLATLEEEGRLEFKRGAGLSKSDISENGANPCIHYGELYTKYEVFIDDIESKTNKACSIHSEHGDVLVPATTTADALGISIARSLNIAGVCIGGDINIIRTKNEYILSDYLAAIISEPPVKLDLAKYAKGANILHLSNSDLRRLVIPVPDIETQKAEVEKIKNEIKMVNINKKLIEIYQKKIKDKLSEIWGQ